MSDPRFADRYRIVRTLGRGSFGVVHLAQDTRLADREVALKVIHPQLALDPESLHLFEKEAGILARLRHDHIVAVYDAGVWQEQRYIVMEYIPGPSLAQVVKEQGAQPPEQVAVWLRQAAQALAYAHEMGVIHRDVKSANLLWDEKRQRLYVTDFGLARAVEMSGGSSSGRSLDVLTGTAAYRAPEVRKTGHTVASDLYSLGVVGYELLAGRRPFEGNDPLDLMIAHAQDPVPPLPEEVPAWLQEVVLRLLEKEPEKRYKEAHELLDALITRRREPDTLDGSHQIKKDIGPHRSINVLLPSSVPPYHLRRGLEVRSLEELVQAAQQHPADVLWHMRHGGLAFWLEILGHAKLASLAEKAESVSQDQASRFLRQFLDETEIAHNYSEESPLVTFDWVIVPAGPFLMGSDPRRDPRADNDEQPQHRVHVETFAISRTPVTNLQYKAFVDATGYEPPKHWKDGRIPAGKKHHPVVCVSWEDAVAFCEWAGVRLPTEAEWEKAARGVDGRIWPWGNEPPTPALCNFNENVGDTTPVGKYPKGASPYGVLDMAGNVWEWCSSLWKAYPYDPDDGREDLEVVKGRVLRGGAWYSDAGRVRCACRHGYFPVSRYDHYGFRVGRVMRGGSWRSDAGRVRCAFRGRDDPYDRYDDGGFRVVGVGAPPAL